VALQFDYLSRGFEGIFGEGFANWLKIVINCLGWEKMGQLLNSMLSLPHKFVNDLEFPLFELMSLYFLNFVDVIYDDQTC